MAKKNEEKKATKATKAVKETKGTVAAKKAAATKAAKSVKGKIAKVGKLLKVAAYRYTSDGEDGVRYVYFRLSDVKDVSAEDMTKVTVSLSRAPGSCIYAVNRLHEHDGHAPPFFSGDCDEAVLKETPYFKMGGEKAATNYLERVFTELAAKVAEVLPGVVIEFEKTEWTTKLPAKPEAVAEPETTDSGDNES